MNDSPPAEAFPRSAGGPGRGRQGRSGRLAGGVRAALFLITTLPFAIAALLVPPILLVGVVTIPIAGLGLLLLPAFLYGVRRWAEFERRRVGRFLGEEITVGYRAQPPGPVAAFKTVVTDPQTLRDLRWVVTMILPGIPFGLLGLIALVGVPATVAQALLWQAAPADDPMTTTIGIPVTSWPVALADGAVQAALLTLLLVFGMPPLARLHARLSARMLAPSPEARLTERIETLSRTREGALDAHASELRRIERDLHDGTQARLVALAMRLGLAQKVIGDDPQAAARLLTEAQNGAEEAMAELRTVVRSIYPPVLADRGLSGAVSALAAGAPVPVGVEVAPLGEVPAAVESTAYFVVAEALTNVARHSGATRAQVQLVRDGGSLVVRVRDDGRGGVDERNGTGVAGMKRRVAALDGSIAVSSPAGGPTAVEAVLPCGS
ncbi:sensor histidine kinase [Nocardiopsis sp. RSe5-2]|uniref:histidine kinase n=1 Tax=Nocardiopsis endophytica TaxID=3018445 RepID=A0ABT4U9V0_9ACTN|nr:sensor histidine kinase [Nocardiopsis endophytica]MDA2813720.1 sensor histidine kinase [Nocardiopsis endophytica]